MSRIDDLIVKYCPNGIEYVSLGKSCEISTGKGITTKDVNNDGVFPIISGGVKPMGFYDKYNRNENTVTIARAGTAGYVDFIQKKFWLNDKCFSIIPLAEYAKKIHTKFMFYYLKNKEVEIIQMKSTGSVPTINTQKVSKILIPVPPLPVQQEIVRILDSFSELEKELEKELDVREKQYEYYRNQLLSFGERGNCTHSVKWIKLGDVAEIYDGTHTTPRYTESGIKFVSVENINDLYATTKYISTEDYNKYKTKPRINDVFMTRIGSIGSCAIVDKNEDLAYYVSLALIRPNTEQILSKYIKYIIESKIGKKELAKRTLMTAVPIKINLSEIGKIQIPLPPLSEQERIVAILDKFDALVNDISIGLPAEIDARRKQYEYYREKLLTFPKVGCDA